MRVQAGSPGRRGPGARRRHFCCCVVFARQGRAAAAVLRGCLTPTAPPRAPVAALFAIITKVGIYATARMTTLVFGADGGAGGVGGVSLAAGAGAGDADPCGHRRAGGDAASRAGCRTWSWPRPATCSSAWASPPNARLRRRCSTSCPHAGRCGPVPRRRSLSGSRADADDGLDARPGHGPRAAVGVMFLLLRSAWQRCHRRPRSWGRRSCSSRHARPPVGR